MSNPSHPTGPLSEAALAFLARFRIDDEHAKPYECAVCGDTGMVIEQQPEPQDAYTGAVRCLCGLGQRLPPMISGRPWKSLAEVWAPEDIVDRFPEGSAPAAFVLRDWMDLSGIPLAYQPWTLRSYMDIVVVQDPPLKKLVRYAETWLKTPLEARSDLLAFGPNGTGKTGLLTAILRGCVEAREACLWTTGAELMETWRGSFRVANIDGERRDVLQRPTTVDVLFIDELGGTRATDFVIDALTTLVDRRQRSNRPTLMTLNVPKQAMGLELDEVMEEALGPALYDRLTSRAQLWPLTGESKRGKRR